MYSAHRVWMLSFAFIHSRVECMQPVSIVGLDALSTDDASVMPFVYCAFVTMTTLGYGDLSPGTGPATTLPMLQQRSGNSTLQS